MLVLGKLTPYYAMNNGQDRTDGCSRMHEIVFMVEEAVEGGYTAFALGHSIITEAGTWEELQVMVRDAVHCHFDSEELPPVIRLHFVRDDVIAS